MSCGSCKDPCELDNDYDTAHEAIELCLGLSGKDPADTNCYTNCATAPFWSHTVAIADSSTSSASSICSLVMTSGTSTRITLRVRAGRDRDQAMLVAILRDLLGFVAAGVLVSCDCTSSMACMPPRPRTSPTIGQRRLPFAGAALKAVAEFVGAGQQVFALEHIEHGQRGRAGQRIAGERAAEAAGAGRVHDLGAAGDGGQRQSTAERLRGHDEDPARCRRRRWQTALRCGRSRIALRRQ